MKYIQKKKHGLSYEVNGWKYISLRGTPKQRGYTYGSFIVKEFKEIQTMLSFVVLHDYGYPWSYFVETSITLLKPTIQTHFQEFYEEMEGIAEGINASGGKTSVDEIIAWNNYFLLTENWFPNHQTNENETNSSTFTRLGEGGGGDGNDANKGKEEIQYIKKERKGQDDRCSAFIATGKGITKDGKIVMAHNNFSNFVDGQFANCVIDMQPEEGKGHRILYMAFAGFIWSGTDFFVTSAGIMGTETTLGGFLPYENKFPLCCRIRQAMQYGNSLDDYVTILWNQNSGDYANAWMFGNIHTNEIMLLELGLKYKNVQRTTNGYYIGYNAPEDPYIRNLECINTGIDDIRRHQGARKVRLDDLIQQFLGSLTCEKAKEIIADHYDIYLEKNNPCSRTCCAHYELDAREYMSDPSRPKPYQPRGALDGNVIDSNMASKMSFSLRYGNSCGIPFNKTQFVEKHRQWKYLFPYLKDRPSQPWTVFSITPTSLFTSSLSPSFQQLLQQRQQHQQKKDKTKKKKKKRIHSNHKKTYKQLTE